MNQATGIASWGRSVAGAEFSQISRIIERVVPLNIFDLDASLAGEASIESSLR